MQGWRRAAAGRDGESGGLSRVHSPASGLRGDGGRNGRIRDGERNDIRGRVADVVTDHAAKLCSVQAGNDVGGSDGEYGGGDAGIGGGVVESHPYAVIIGSLPSVGWRGIGCRGNGENCILSVDHGLVVWLHVDDRYISNGEGGDTAGGVAKIIAGDTAVS